MRQRHKPIQIFEHSELKLGTGKKDLNEKQLKALQLFHQKHGNRYFSLIYNGIKFKEYVGTLQVGNLSVEILPKADKYQSEEEWQDILIGMLQAVGLFKVYAPSSSALRVKQNSILDLYFELFIKEVEYLVNLGLIKKYRKNECNKLALKGSLVFSKHLQKNLIHKERFYTKHTTYDKKHLLHGIIYKTLILLQTININPVLSSRINSLLLYFPDTDNLKVTEHTFNKITFGRKTENYRNAIEIARLLLLNFHPDLSKGQNNVLALMFDMNLLWERFIYAGLRKYKKKGVTIRTQAGKYFWRSGQGKISKIRPDIIINTQNRTIVIDTKWKNIADKNPSTDDLRQMYVYHKYYNADKVLLVYPGAESSQTGTYYLPDGAQSSIKCGVISISVKNDSRKWQESIYNTIMNSYYSN